MGTQWDEASTPQHAPARSMNAPKRRGRSRPCTLHSRADPVRHGAGVNQTRSRALLLSSPSSHLPTLSDRDPLHDTMLPAALCPLPLAASRACGSLTQRSASATSTGGVDHLNAAPSLVSVAQPRQEPSIHLQSTGPPAACHLPPALNQLHALDDTQHTLGWASKGPRQIKSQLRAPSLHPFHRGSWFHAGLCLLPRRFSKILRAPR
jgi:hypothetical protein